MKLEMRQLRMFINNIKIKFLFLFFLLCSILYSTDSFCVNESVTIKNDSSKTEVRRPNPEEQKKILEDKDYKYDRVGPAPKSAWERFTEWFWRWVDKIFSSTGGKIGFNIFKYLLIAAAIGIIIYLLLKNNFRALFYGKSASVQIDFSEFEEDIHKINFDMLIEEAIAKKDFKKAIRLHFLKLLKELTDKNLIVWQIDKTNNDYSIELSNSKYSAQFKELALLYEYIWYGDFQLDETNFISTIAKFKDLKIVH